ncbi:MAG: DUF2309 domain-containing protein [Ilumatobacteraceae bacterium]
MTDTIAPETPAAVRNAIAGACARVAPTWPLDRFNAVNPYWGWRESPIADVAARLGALAGTALTMPRAWFRDERAAGRLADHHLDAAASALGDPGLAAVARELLVGPQAPETPALQRLALVADIVDSGPGPAPAPGRTWSDLVAHQIGQHCAAHFDEWQATWAPDQQTDLFDAWRVDPSVTHGFHWRRGSAWARERLDSLPDSSTGSIAVVMRDLGIAEDAGETYLTAVLASVNGWAAWCAYRRWQAQLAGGDDATIVDLLAIRVVWEWLLACDLDDTAETPARLASWAAAWSNAGDVVDANRDAQRVDWVLQAAVERTYQDSLIHGLAQATPTAGPPTVQAVFCIDVRSEIFRRALEATEGSVQTGGFAGFFGLPIAYTPAGSALTRPQLPGLLAPALDVTDVASDRTSQTEIAGRSEVLAERQRWDAFRRQPSSVFSFVETLGLRYAIKLVKESLPHRHRPAKWELDGIGDDGDRLRPRLALVDDDPAAAAALARRVLVGMGMVDGFAPLVMLCGHRSLSVNNPHAAGLDCGACGGQSGEVNARVFADLLNDPNVRHELRGLAVDVPASTWFVAGLHTTTTDVVELFDTELAPDSLRQSLSELAARLRVAGDLARAERAASLGLGHLVSSPRRLERTMMERANDWSQVRPEWGLADNAAFIVAPRWRTRHLDLQGRCFLHDYDWRRDPDLTVLTLIMTAPMVVTNWINMQYHASTVDNRRYGSGNKVLHNVVGGHIGVFEGNGGDLRIGLPIQSLHDGESLRHRPLRVSVFIEAPHAAIDAVIDGQPIVRDLVHNGWLNLLRIEPSNGTVEERRLAGSMPGTWGRRAG